MPCNHERFMQSPAPRVGLEEMDRALPHEDLCLDCGARRINGEWLAPAQPDCTKTVITGRVKYNDQGSLVIDGAVLQDFPYADRTWPDTPVEHRGEIDGHCHVGNYIGRDVRVTVELLTPKAACKHEHTTDHTTRWEGDGPVFPDGAVFHSEVCLDCGAFRRLDRDDN